MLYINTTYLNHPSHTVSLLPCHPSTAPRAMWLRVLGFKAWCIFEIKKHTLTHTQKHAFEKNNLKRMRKKGRLKRKKKEQKRR